MKLERKEIAQDVAIGIIAFVAIFTPLYFAFCDPGRIVAIGELEFKFESSEPPQTFYESDNSLTMTVTYCYFRVGGSDHFVKCCYYNAIPIGEKIEIRASGDVFVIE